VIPPSPRAASANRVPAPSNRELAPAVRNGDPRHPEAHQGTPHRLRAGGWREIRTPNAEQHGVDLVFLSFNSLTTAGGAHLILHGVAARALVVLELVTGTLYMGAFVARLVGMYGDRLR
jgi:hypothetical protein